MGDELDRIIDTALPSYSEATPRPGLEQRVRNRIRIGEADRRRTRLLGFAMALAAALVVLAVVLGTHPSSTPKMPEMAVAVQRPRTAPSPGYVPGKQSPPGLDDVTEPRPPGSGKLHAARTKPLPKQQQFPVVTPFTGPERALLALVAQHPDAVQQLVADMQRRNGEPIDIQAIQIKPLRSDGEQ